MVADKKVVIVEHQGKNGSYVSPNKRYERKSGFNEVRQQKWSDRYDKKKQEISHHRFILGSQHPSTQLVPKNIPERPTTLPKPKMKSNTNTITNISFVPKNEPRPLKTPKKQFNSMSDLSSINKDMSDLSSINKDMSDLSSINKDISELITESSNENNVFYQGKSEKRAYSRASSTISNYSKNDDNDSLSAMKNLSVSHSSISENEVFSSNLNQNFGYSQDSEGSKTIFGIKLRNTSDSSDMHHDSETLPLNRSISDSYNSDLSQPSLPKIEPKVNIPPLVGLRRNNSFKKKKFMRRSIPQELPKFISKPKNPTMHNFLKQYSNMKRLDNETSLKQLPINSNYVTTLPLQNMEHQEIKVNQVVKVNEPQINEIHHTIPRENKFANEYLEGSEISEKSFNIQNKVHDFMDNRSSTNESTKEEVEEPKQNITDIEFSNTHAEPREILSPKNMETTSYLHSNYKKSYNNRNHVNTIPTIYNRPTSMYTFLQKYSDIRSLEQKSNAVPYIVTAKLVEAENYTSTHSIDSNHLHDEDTNVSLVAEFNSIDSFSSEDNDCNNSKSLNNDSDDMAVQYMAENENTIENTAYNRVEENNFQKHHNERDNFDNAKLRRDAYKSFQYTNPTNNLHQEKKDITLADLRKSKPMPYKVVHSNKINNYAMHNYNIDKNPETTNLQHYYSGMLHSIDRADKSSNKDQKYEIHEEFKGYQQISPESNRMQNGDDRQLFFNEENDDEIAEVRQRLHEKEHRQDSLEDVLSDIEDNLTEPLSPKVLTKMIVRGSRISKSGLGNVNSVEISQASVPSHSPFALNMKNNDDY